jgi:hypothetical protein
MANDFTKNGIPKDLEIKYGIEEEKARLDKETLLETIENYNQSKAENRKIDIDESLKFYESKDVTVNISLDGIVVVAQKETGRSSEKKKKEGRKYAENIIVDIQKDDKSYVLNAKSVEEVMPSIIGLLILNGILQNNLEFFIDGASNLKNNINKYFGYSNCYHIILDWYHLEQKCKVKLSLACKGREIRNDILNELTPILWLGKVDAPRMSAVPDVDIGYKNEDKDCLSSFVVY